MSRARHKEEKKRASGGKLSSKPVWNAGGEQNAAKEAEELKRGGRVHMRGEGDEPRHRADRPKRARGGKVEHHHLMHHRAKGGRLRGEGMGADKTPLSSAAKIKEVTKGEQASEGVKSD